MLDNRTDVGYRTRGDLLADCELLEQSGLFDADMYNATAGLAPEQNGAEHYLLQGWRDRLEPGPSFEGSSILIFGP